MSTHKVVKVGIRRGGEEEEMMVYPDRYNSREVDRKGIGPSNVMGISAYSGEIGMGGTEETCFIILPNELAEEYAEDPDMEIVSKQFAEETMRRWRNDKARMRFGDHPTKEQKAKVGPPVISLERRFPKIVIE